MSTFTATVTFANATDDQVGTILEAVHTTSGLRDGRQVDERTITFCRDFERDSIPLRAVQVACEEALVRGTRGAGITVALDYSIDVVEEAPALVAAR